MRSGYSRTAGPACRIALEPSQIPHFPELPQVTRRHAMNSGVVTDIGKEASIARSGSTDDETKPTAGAQFAPCGRRSPNRATPLCSRVRPGVGPPPLRDWTTRWTTLAAQCDCNLHSSRAQFVEGANRVFDQQIDAS